MNREKAIKILIAKLTDQQLFDDVLQPELVKAMEYAASFMEARPECGAKNRPPKCYTVIDTSYDVGIDVYSFWNKEDAERSVKDDVQTELANLREACRERIVVQETLDGATIYVPDTDIYYEWTIVETDIR